MSPSKQIILLPAILLAIFSGTQGQGGQNGNQIIITLPPESYECENISSIYICEQIGYPTGSFPNWRDQRDIIMADQELRTYLPVIRTVCSEAIVHLLCSVYAPFCDPQLPHIRLPPCRELCEYVREGCEPVFEQFGHSWPPVLDCDRYPTQEETRLSFCSNDLQNLTIPSNIPIVRTAAPPTNVPGNNNTGLTDPVITVAPTAQTLMLCPDNQRTRDRFINQSYRFAGIDNCAVPCGGLYFTEEERNRVAPGFILVFAIICVLFTLFTVATFLIDRHRFHYPERPIIYLSFCYLIIAISYIVGSVSKLVGQPSDSFACSEPIGRDEIAGGYSYVFQSLPNPFTTYKSASCVILFVLVYFFQMASGIWWVILTLTWFLAAALKWGEEAVERLWLLYHVVAWSVPCLQVILVLALRLVDGDQLAGLCFTGNANPVGLGVFVFLPLTLYLSLGIVFLVIGFTALVNISREVQNDQLKSQKIGRLIMRIGIYSLLYIIPNIILLILYIYQMAREQNWELSQLQCRSTTTSSSLFCESAEYPSIAAFIIRYIVLFLIGICSTSWVLSSKTLAAWKRFFCSCGCNQNVTVAATNAKYILSDKKEGDLSIHGHSMQPQTAV